MQFKAYIFAASGLFTFVKGTPSLPPNDSLDATPQSQPWCDWEIWCTRRLWYNGWDSSSGRKVQDQMDSWGMTNMLFGPYTSPVLIKEFTSDPNGDDLRIYVCSDHYCEFGNPDSNPSIMCDWRQYWYKIKDQCAHYGTEYWGTGWAYDPSQGCKIVMERIDITPNCSNTNGPGG